MHDVAADGTLYVTTGAAGVFKLARAAGTLAKLTALPTDVTHNAVAIDPNETVVLALKNGPTGPRLMVGDANVGGFRYTDINSRPVGTGGKAFGNPAGPNNTSLDFSESNTNLWARTYVNSVGWGGNGAFSTDGGVSWATFGQLAYRYVYNSPTADWETFDVAPCLRRTKAANPNAVVTLVVHSGSWDFVSSYLHFSSKEGGNAPRLLINNATTLTTTADTTAKKRCRRHQLRRRRGARWRHLPRRPQSLDLSEIRSEFGARQHRLRNLASLSPGRVRHRRLRHRGVCERRHVMGRKHPHLEQPPVV